MPVDIDGVDINPHDFLTLARDIREGCNRLKPRDDPAQLSDRECLESV